MSQPPQRPDLQRFTGYLLRRAFVKSTGVARACMPEDAQVREVAILSILAERGAVSQTVLSDLTSVNRSLIVKLVDSLEAKGWVVRDRNLLDRRLYALRMTPAGERALRELELDLDRGEAELTSGLTRRETDRLRELLTTLLDGDPSLEASSLRHRCGFLIAQAHRLLRESAADAMTPTGLHPRDFGALSVLATDAPCSQNHLAERLGISPPAVLAFVDELEARRLIARSRNKDDRRAYDLTLTRDGAKRLAAAREVAAGVQSDIRERLGPDGDEELRALLDKLLG